MGRSPCIPAILFIAVAAMSCQRVGERGSQSGTSTTAEFTGMARDFLDWYYETHPVTATGLGIHDHDANVADWSSQSILERVAALEAWLERLLAIRQSDLGGVSYHDYRILEYAIRAQLLELQEVRSWQRSPMMYVGAGASAISSLSDRNFAPVGDRMQSMTARMETIPRLLSAARENLSDVPPLWVDLAIRNGRGAIAFLRDDLPAALAEQGFDKVPAAERDRWDEVRRATIDEFERFVAWLENELSRSASGDFRIGRDIFERKLLYEEHVSMSADELRDINERAIARYREWVAREAARIDSNAPVEDVMAGITNNFPGPEKLLPTAREFVETTRAFVIANGIVTLPSNELPIVRPTPEYARLGFASMSTPGPFETQGRESYYNITNVDPAWSDEQKAQHLSYFNYPGLLGITIHEVMPGHFVQLLYESSIPTDVRKVFTPASLVEGWAHYAEQMMIDEGLGDEDPAIRLGQLRRALQRHARWYAGLAMHVYGASVEEASERFQEIAYFAPFPALRETQRGTYDPTYLYYALGRMQILKLQQDVRRQKDAEGEPFSLREFHDTFLKLGLPASLAREELLGEDAGPSL